jgi:hypothetical protein
MGVVVVTWAGMVNGDVGAPVEMGDFGDRSIQVSGTFDTSTIVLEGSNNGSNYLTLTDPQGNALSKTSEAIEQVQEVPRYTRPSVTAGGASTSLTMTLLLRKP